MAAEPALLAVRTTNISRGGFVCLTSAPLEVGGVLRVQVQLTPHDALDCRAQVVRVDELDSSPRRAQHLVAFRFVDLCDGEERQVLEAIEALGADTDPAAGPKAYRSDRATAGR